MEVMRMPIFPPISVAANPLVPFSTRSVLWPRWGGFASGFGLAENDEKVCDRSVRREDLCSVDDIGIALL